MIHAAKKAAALSAAALICFAGAAAAEEAAFSLHTLGVYRSDLHDFSAEIATFYISGPASGRVIGALNAELAALARRAVKEYEQEVSSAFKDSSRPHGHLAVTLGSAVKTDNDKIFAFDIFRTEAAGSSSENHRFYCFDKKSGSLIELKDLFSPGYDYVGEISGIVKKQMRAANKSEDAHYQIAPEPGGFDAIRPDHNFYINGSGNIVICFDKYEVAPGAFGSPEFEIPYDAGNRSLSKQQLR